MPFRLFHDYFPEVAERETRSITVLPHSDLDLPVGSYGFLEMFCDERGCDCRRVFFAVMASFRKDPQAIVAWGWEDLAFYSRWLKYGDRQDAKDMQGPILNPGSPQTELSGAILALTRKVLLADTNYIERVKRHYAMFRSRVDGGKKKHSRKKR